MIKGYPPEGNFFGKRTVTRYEMATIVQRALARIEELLAGKADRGETAAPAGVKPEDLEEVRRLVNEFKLELGNIGTDLQQVKEMLGDLKDQVAGAKAAAEAASETAGRVKTDFDDLKSEFGEFKESFSIFRSEYEIYTKAANGRKLSGYLQTRFEAFEPGKSGLFSSGTGGTGQTPTTGGPTVGGPKYGWLIRRARLKFGGQLATRTDWALQLDTPSTGAVAIKDAYINLADLPLPTNWTTTVGLFAFPFGQELPVSSSARESPERALGFSDSTAATPIFKHSVSSTGGTVTPGSVLPMWMGQDRDVGAMVTYNAPNFANPLTKISVGIFNGEGRGASGVRNLNNGLDLMARAQTTILGGHLDLGVSGYYGTIAVRGGAPTGTPPTPVSFVNAYRMLLGADLRYYTPWGGVLRAEFMGGVYEVTPDRARYLQGNHAHAWYVTLKQPLSKRFEIAAKYDEFYPISQTGKTAGGLGRMDLVRKTLGLGALYYFDDVTRLRVWYLKGLTPYDPSAAVGSLNRSKLGFFTGEVQITY